MQALTVLGTDGHLEIVRATISPDFYTRPCGGCGRHARILDGDRFYCYGIRDRHGRGREQPIQGCLDPTGLKGRGRIRWEPEDYCSPGCHMDAVNRR